MSLRASRSSLARGLLGRHVGGRAGDGRLPASASRRPGIGSAAAPGRSRAAWPRRGRPPRSQTMTLPGLMSRWIRPMACASRRAPQTCRRKWTARAAGSGPCCLDQLAQGQARQVLHDVVERAVLGVAVVEDLDGVRVGQGRRGPGPRARSAAGSVASPARSGRISLIAHGRRSSTCSAR